MQSFLCFSLIAILLVGNVITPISISSAHFGIAYAQVSDNSTATVPVDSTTTTVSDNSTATVPVDSTTTTVSDNSTATVPVDSTTTTVSDNSTATVPVDSTTTTVDELIPVDTQPPAPDPLQTLSNETSQQLTEQGYAVQSGVLTTELTSFSLSAWVKPDYSMGSPEFTVISKENAFALAINNNISPYHIAKFSVYDGIKWSTVESISTIEYGWAHLVGTFDGSSINIYVNGNLESAIPVTGIPAPTINGQLTLTPVDSISSNSDIVIGAYLNENNGYEPSNQFSGLIDTANIYDLIISQSQISDLFNTSPHSADLAKPTLITDKTEYFPQETVQITGSGLAPNRSYDVVVVRSDGWIVKNDGTDGYDSVYTDSTGSFVYHYNLESIAGDYLVRVYNSDNEHSAVLASTGFIDIAPTLVTDKADYLPYEPVQITGTGFTAGTSYDIVITWPDGSVIKDDGVTSGFDSIMTDGNGGINYSYKLDNMSGLYWVKAFSSVDVSHTNVVASTSFADPPSISGPLFAGMAFNKGSGWTFPSNAGGSSDARCAVALGNSDNSKKIYLNNFGFNIPAQSTILGITAKIDYGDTNGYTIDDERPTIQLLKAGNPTGIAKSFEALTSATSCTTSDFVTVPPTATDDLWGEQWTAVDINNADFGMAIKSGTSGGNRYLDRVQITVLYSEAPVANADSSITTEDTAITVAVLANDLDAENDPLTVSSVTQGSSGSVIINADGTLTYTPITNFNGGDSFSYTISDGNGGTATATVSVTVTPVNDAPVANDDTSTTFEDNEITINVADNDSDIEGDKIIVAAVTQGASGTVTIKPDDDVVYTPISDFNGQDSFTYTVSDGNGGMATATVTIDVIAQNDKPQAADDTVVTTEDTPLAIVLTATDIDRDALTFVINKPSKGVITGVGPDIVYTPDPEYVGPDSFTFKVNDGQTDSNDATIFIDVTPVNDAPVANDDTAATTEDTAVTVNTLVNDIDIEGDALSITSSTQGSSGTTTVNLDGTITYAPIPNSNGQDSFTYTISDGSGGMAEATVTVDVTPVNDAPTANGDTPPIVTEDNAITISVLANDNDIDNDPLTVISVTQGSSGTTTVNLDGTITYAPSGNFNGQDSFSYTISDGNGGMATATVTVDITATNDAPVANGDTAATTEDTAVTVNVVSNDNDIDNDPLSVVSVTQGSSGSVMVNADNTVTYTPIPNSNGQDSFTYTISDGSGGMAEATVTVDVTPVNDAPTANDDTAATTEDTAVTVNTLVNDIDIEGDALSITSSTQGSSGTTTVNLDGTITYTPSGNFNGQDSFTYTISDGNGGMATATVTVDITATNDAPVANDDTAATTEDTAVTVNTLVNDIDIEGDALSITSSTQGSSGTTTVNLDGTITYAPIPNSNGQDSFTYTISDGNGGVATATVDVDVTPVNDAPVANGDTAATTEDTAVTVNVVSNDNDIDNDPLSVVSVTQGSSGSVMVNADNTVTYTPIPNSNGQDSFTYTISDGSGGMAEATVTVDVTPVNDAPTANGDTPPIVTEDNAITISVLANDNDIDNDPLSVVSVTQGSSGSVMVNADNTVTYTPASNFNGQDSFSYTISDGNGGMATATVTVDITATNDAPVANGDSAIAAEDIFINIDVITNDEDADNDPLSVVSVTQGSNGAVTLNADGTVTYNPMPNFNGQDSFTYTISDGSGGMAEATVTVDVIPVNDTPLANGDSATTNEDNAITAVVLANDNDIDGDTLSVTLVLQGTSGMVTLNADGTVTYNPMPNFNGQDSFTYTISDGSGGMAEATVTVDVIPVNDTPLANGDVAPIIEEDSSVNIDVLSNDNDIDGEPLSVVSVTQGSRGIVTINTDNTVTFTPASNFNGQDSFTYTISDGNGGMATATVTVDITATNDAPTANGDSATTNEDNAITAVVLANDNDIDNDPLSVVSVTQGSSGSVMVNADNTVTYTPIPNSNGQDSFTYTISDGSGGMAEATVTVDVIPVNDTPLANGDSALAAEDSSVNIDVLSNDNDIDGDTLSVTSATQGSNGAVTINGDNTVTYAPASNFNGQDSFTYTISDGNGGMATATVMIIVSAIDDTSVANDDAVTTNEDTSVNISVLSNDNDIDGDTLSVTSATQGSNGAVTINGDNTVTYAPASNFNGQDSFTYTISDGNGGMATATVTVDVTPVNDNPLANGDSATTSLGVIIDVDVVANDEDVDANKIKVASVTQGKHGTVTIKSDDVVRYTPQKLFFGTDSFTYAISDGNGGTASANVDVVVTYDGSIGKADTDYPIILPNNVRADFDVESDGVDISGWIEYKDRKSHIKLRSTDITFFSLDVTATKATFEGTAKVNYVGGYTFTAFAEDNRSIGIKDTFSIVIKNDQGIIIYENSGKLKKGDIDVER